MSETKNSLFVQLASDLGSLEKTLTLLEKHAVSEVEWERNGERVKISLGQKATRSSDAFITAQAPTSVPPAAGGKTQVQSAPALKAPSNPKLKEVKSPFVGTFYRSKSPTSEPYVTEGSRVKSGDALCIVEAMKLMNEIESEFSGTIAKVLVQNGQPVEFGEPLFVIELD